MVVKITSDSIEINRKNEDILNDCDLNGIKIFHPSHTDITILQASGSILYHLLFELSCLYDLILI